MTQHCRDGRREPETADLQDLIDREMEVCRTLLETNRAVVHAAAALDLGGLDQSIASRGRLIQELGALAGQTRHLSAPGLSKEAALGAQRQDLERVMEAVGRSEEQAGRAIVDAVAHLRREIQTLDAGRHGLRGYRGAACHPPRFADKRG